MLDETRRIAIFPNYDSYRDREDFLFTGILRKYYLAGYTRWLTVKKVLQKMHDCSE